MSKELEAFYDLIDVYFDNEVVKEKYGITEQTFIKKKKIVEKALKDYEKSQRIVGTTTVSKALKQFLIQQCPEVENKLQALEIIKEKNVIISVLKMSKSLIGYHQLLSLTKTDEQLRKYMLDQEEYDLLKEELL